MRTQGIPALLLPRLASALFLIGSTAASAQLANAGSAIGSSSLSADGAFAPGIAAMSDRERIQPALMAFEEMLQRHRALGNLEGEAEALAAIGSSYRALKREQKAIEYFQSALVVWRGLGRQNDEATTIAHIGDAYREWGFPDQAIRFYRKALTMYSRTADREGEAVDRNNIGVAYLMLKDRRKCFDYFDQALTLYRMNHDFHGEANTLGNLAAAYTFFLAKDPEKALIASQQILVKLEPLHDPVNEANVLDLIGVTFSRLNREQMAEISFERALALYHALGDAQGESVVSSNMRRLGARDHYRVNQIDATIRATPEPLRPTAALLKVFDTSTEP